MTRGARASRNRPGHADSRDTVRPRLRNTGMNRPRTSAALALAAPLSTSSAAHAGPTVATDLDLGTSVGQGITAYTRSSSPPTGPVASFPALYVVGFRVRAGWRFDVGPVWLLPEIGGGYDVERFHEGAGVQGYALPRAFGGGRAGVSVPLAPSLRFEPGVYGHTGYARYWLTGGPDDGLANDVGLSLDLRFLRYFIVGAQVGYDVVTVWQSPPTSSLTTPPMSGMCSMSAFGMCAASAMPSSASGGSTATADKWVSYGIHAGVLLW
jgi:hypothetical protein